MCHCGIQAQSGGVGQASHSEPDDMDWESEAADLAEEEASLEVHAA